MRNKEISFEILTRDHIHPECNKVSTVLLGVNYFY
jgi:hypothetical protein